MACSIQELFQISNSGFWSGQQPTSATERKILTTGSIQELVKFLSALTFNTWLPGIIINV